MPILLIIGIPLLGAAAFGLYKGSEEASSKTFTVIIIAAVVFLVVYFLILRKA